MMIKLPWQITNWFYNLVKVFPNRGGQTQKRRNMFPIKFQFSVDLAVEEYV